MWRGSAGSAAAIAVATLRSVARPKLATGPADPRPAAAVPVQRSRAGAGVADEHGTDGDPVHAPAFRVLVLEHLPVIHRQQPAPFDIPRHRRRHLIWREGGKDGLHGASWCQGWGVLLNQ